MLTLDEAVSLAVRHVSELGDDLVLEQEPIAHGDYGWVFSYQSAKYLRTGSFSDMLAGNAPLLIEQKTGAIHTLGTAHPTSFYIENLLNFGDPHQLE